MTLDEWSDDEIDAMVEVGGNASANSIYEAFIPEGYSKPGPDSNNKERAKFIRLDNIRILLAVYNKCLWLSSSIISVVFISYLGSKLHGLSPTA